MSPMSSLRVGLVSPAALASLAPAALAASAALIAGCKGGEEKAATSPPPPVTAVTLDAGAPPPPDAGVTALPTFDPGSGFHLDEAPVVRPSARTPARDRKVVQILLRSTPTGAIAAVDGVRLGSTPVLWEGVLDGQPHEFTFVAAGHALARYRFVPVTGGIVHGTLTKLTSDRDAGVPEIPPVVVPPGRVLASPPPGHPGAPPRVTPPPASPSPPPPPVDAAPAAVAPPPVDASPASPFAPPP